MKIKNIFTISGLALLLLVSCGETTSSNSTTGNTTGNNGTNDSSSIIPPSSSASISIDLGEMKKYYSIIDFTKSKQEVKSSLFRLINKHTVLSYSSGLSALFKESDVKSDGSVYDIYSNIKQTYSKPCGNYKVEGDCWNREHSVPQSWFGKASPMVSDAFHMYPTDGKVNGTRSDYYYGETNGKIVSTNGSKLGSSTFQGYSGTVFEPIDEYKGDLARSYFYMVTAYEDKAGNWGRHFASNNYTKLTTYSLNLFLKWAKEDPVSEKEINRNNVIYKHQKNRNPYIDYPNLAENIFTI